MFSCGFVQMLLHQSCLGHVKTSNLTAHSPFGSSMLIHPSAIKTLGSGSEQGCSRPPCMRRRRLHHEYLTGPRVIGCVLHATPLAHDHEQRPAIVPAEHAGEASTIEIDPLKHLAAFANAHATLVGDVGVPHGAFGIDADSVRHAVAELGPG